MKKLVALLVLLLLLPLAAQADVDLTGMSFSELVALKEKIDFTLWQMDDWQEVTVPQGIWKIGEDIPEGHWTIKAYPGSYAYVRYGNALEANGQEISYKSNNYYSESVHHPDSYSYEEGQDRLQIDIELKNGSYIAITSGDVVFTPYTGKPSLGFKFK